jgi:hypothetical protein
MSPLLQLVHLLAAAYMTGVIWFVQLVQYPMFHHTDGADGNAHAEYTRRMGYVVLPVMVAELVLQTLWLAGSPTPAARTGAVLLLAIWLSTFLLQVPCHRRLVREGHNPAVQRRLVRTNWIRTLAWTARAVLIAAGLA